MVYEITIPYDVYGERNGKSPEECESYEVIFESDAQFNKGDQIEWDERLLYISNRRPVVIYQNETRPTTVDRIKLFCMNI